MGIVSLASRERAREKGGEITSRSSLTRASQDILEERQNIPGLQVETL